jgi:membrane-associated phospholipid phosphatase
MTATRGEEDAMAASGIRRLLVAVAVGGAVPVLAACADHGPLSDLDRRAFAAVRARRGPAVVRAARIVSALAEPHVAYPVLALAGSRAARRGAWWQAIAPCLVVAGGAAARRRLSRVIARPRPPEDAWLAEPEGFSLPSKHTTLAALSVGAALRGLGVRGAPAHAATALAAAGVGTSRVCLGVHWPADVVAGWLFAVGWLHLTDPVTEETPEQSERRPAAWPCSKLAELLSPELRHIGPR